MNERFSDRYSLV